MSDMSDSVSWHVLLGTIITIIPATISVAGRFVARTKKPLPVGLQADDWLIFASLIFNWVMASLRFYQIRVDSYGHHASALPQAKVADFQKSFLAVQCAYFTSAVLTKSSLLYLYYRIFGVSAPFTRVLWGAWALVVAYFVVAFGLALGGCHPVSFFWDRDQEGECIDEVNFFRWNGIVNMFLDVVVFSLPLPMVWRLLNLGFRKKLALTGIFMLGAFVCIASIFRILAFNRQKQTDPTYTTVDTATWSQVEQSVGIICACLPTLEPLFRGRGSRAKSYNAAMDLPLDAFDKKRSSSQRFAFNGLETESMTALGEGGSIVTASKSREDVYINR